LISDARSEKGRRIAQLNEQVRRIDEHSYRVRSQSGNGEYEVISGELGWLCSCPDHMYRGQKCKHIYAVEFSLEIRKTVENEIVAASITITPITISACPRCQSDKIVKHGVRQNKSSDIQRFFCNDCGKWFVVNLGFERMHATPQIITSAIQLYFTGESLRNVQKFLRLQGINVSHVAVYKWINKYVALMQKYLEQIKPNVSDTWRADELFVKVKGNMKYLFAIMDDETRFWIAQEVADSKFKHDARNIFRKGKVIARKRPLTMITDGLQAYQHAVKEYYSNVGPRTKHIYGIKLQGPLNNNKMERLNGEIRDREKVVRGVKKNDTAILTGYQIYHNYVRPHEGLNGSTPADAAAIKIEGDNKWVTVIQNATLARNEPTVNTKNFSGTEPLS
jgi:putative transposase